MKTIIFMAFFLSCPASQAADALLAINDTVFEVELAITPEERKTGLMRRKKLASNQGMLFIYPEPQIISFWMKQTLIPLDILFFDSHGQLLETFEDIPPCKTSNCKRYTNQNPSQFVLEVPAGTTRQLKIMIGDGFEIRHKD